MATDGFSQRLSPKYHKLMLKVPQIETNTQELNVSQFLYPRISIQTNMVGLHTADTFSRVLPRSWWCHYCLWGFCLVLHVLNSICSSCEACCSLLSICQALSLSFFSILLPPRGPPTRCCCHSPYLLLYISTPLSCTGLMTVWYLSRVPSVPWHALLCHCCCLVSLSSSSFFTLEANRL